MEYVMHLAILFAIYAILGISLNLVVGWSGFLSATHAAWYALGAYATAILTTRGDFNFLFSILAGMILATGISFLLGLVLSKFKGDYYVLVSLGFNVIAFAVFLNWQSLTRGPLGITNIPRPEILGINFSNNFNFLILITIFLIGIFFISRFLTRSSFGRALKAIREDEEALRVFGYNTYYFKLAIFTIGAALAAVAGSFFASFITFIDPSSFTINESIFILAIIILGGLGSLRGSILGALFLVLLPEILRFVGFPNEVAAQMRQLIYGLTLVLLMLYRPQGLIGEYKL